MYRPRLIEKKLIELFRYYPVIAVLGARQVGKSTLVENLFGAMVESVVFDPVVDIENSRQDPDFFLQNHPPESNFFNRFWIPVFTGVTKLRLFTRAADLINQQPEKRFRPHLDLW